MKKSLVGFAIGMFMFGMAGMANATTIYYDTGQSYTIGGVAGSDIYLGSNVNDNIYLDYAYPPSDPGTHLNIRTGGSIEGILLAFGYSSVTMDGGWVGGTVQLTDYSTVTMSGGSVSGVLNVFNDSVVTISGGSVSGSLNAMINGIIYLDGTDFAVNGTPLVAGDRLSDFDLMLVEHDINPDYYTGTITGTLSDGFALNSGFRIYNTDVWAGTADIIITSSGTINPVPEPATMLLFGTGIVGLAGTRLRKKKQ